MCGIVCISRQYCRTHGIQNCRFPLPSPSKKNRVQKCPGIVIYNMMVNALRTEYYATVTQQSYDTIVFIDSVRDGVRAGSK